MTRSRVRRSARTAAAAAIWLAFAPDARPQETTLVPRILWDRYAVPNIYGPDVTSVTRGLGYASMENHAEVMLRKIARARGRLAEYFGAGASDENLLSDEQIALYGLRDVANDWVLRGGAFQASLLRAYCDGVNEYAVRHASDIPAELRPILPMIPSDVAAIGSYLLYYLFEDGQNFVQQTAAAWQTAAIASTVAAPARGVGSNAIVVGPAKSASGHAIIVSNSHLPWGTNQPAFINGYTDGTLLMEAHLVVGDPRHPALNASGVSLPGLPLLLQGFNDFGGWSHTANTIYNADLFELTLDRTGHQYLFGGAYRPLARGEVKLLVLQADGSTKTVVVPTSRSLHGPVIAVSKDGKRALALRMAGIDQPAAVTQYWNMLRATDLASFKTALSALQAPLFNVFFADRKGETYYLFGGRQPVRHCPFRLTYNSGSLIPPIEDGANPACLWTRTLALEQLPQSTNPPGGYIANGNEAPWYASFPQPDSLKQGRYPGYITADGVDMRPQSLQRLLLSHDKLTRGEVLSIKNSVHMLLADRVLPDLLDLARAAARDGDTIAEQAAAVLGAWDRTADADSSGGALFEAWWTAVGADVGAGKISADESLAYSNNLHPKFRVAFDPDRPLATPSGLDPANGARLVADLDQAFAGLATTFADKGGAAVRWGDAHKLTLVTRTGPLQATVKLPPLVNSPLSGADDPFGAVRVVDPLFDPHLGEYVSYGGESYIHVIEFTPDGPQGGSLLVYGNASRPNSPHIADQADLFRQGRLKPELRSLSQVEAAAIRSETY